MYQCIDTGVTMAASKSKYGSTKRHGAQLMISLGFMIVCGLEMVEKVVILREEYLILREMIG